MDTVNGNYLGTRAYARHRGVSAGYISRLCTDGTITRGADGKIDARAADATLDALRAVAHPNRLEANARQRQAKPDARPDRGSGDAEPDAGTWADQKRRLARAQADLAEWERDRLRGVLCECAEVARAIAEIGPAVAALHVIPDKITARMRAAPTEHAARLLLAGELDAGCHAVADFCLALVARMGSKPQ